MSDTPASDESILFQGFEEYAEAQQKTAQDEERAYAAVHLAVHERFDERRDTFRYQPVEMLTLEAIAREAMEWVRMLGTELGARACGLRFRAPDTGRAMVEGLQDPDQLVAGGVGTTLQQIIGRVESAPGGGSEFALARSAGVSVGVLVQPLSLPAADGGRVACGCIWYLKQGAADEAVGFRAGHLWAAAAFARDWDSELSSLVERARAAGHLTMAVAREPAEDEQLESRLAETIDGQRRLYEERLPDKIRELCGGGTIEARLFGCSIAMNAASIIALTSLLRSNLFAVHEGLQRLPAADQFFLRYAGQGGLWPIDRERGVRALHADLVAYLGRGPKHRHVFEHTACMVGAGLAAEGNHPSMRRGLSLTRAGRFAAREFLRLGVEHAPLVQLLSDSDDTGVVTTEEPEIRRNMAASNVYESIALATTAVTVLETGRDQAALDSLLRRQEREYRDIALFLVGADKGRAPLFGGLSPRTLDVLGALDDAGRRALGR